MSSERRRRGLMLVLSSPSGVGKTSLSRRLVADHPELDLSISMTTRAPRPGKLHGHQRSGTLKSQVMASLAAGRDVMFDVDWQGARAIVAEAARDTVRIF